MEDKDYEFYYDIMVGYFFGGYFLVYFYCDDFDLDVWIFIINFYCVFDMFNLNELWISYFIKDV